MAELNLIAPARSGILYDAFGSQDFCAALLDMIWRPRRIKAAQGEIEAVRWPELRKIMGESSPPKPTPARSEHSNSCVIFEDKLMLKLFRRLEPGLNPELEMGRFLNSHSFPHCPSVAGGLEYIGPAGFHLTLAVVHVFIPSATNAWDFTLDAIGRYYDRVHYLGRPRAIQRGCPSPGEPIQLLRPDFPPNVAETIGTYLESARLLGVHTATQTAEFVGVRYSQQVFFPGTFHAASSARCLSIHAQPRGAKPAAAGPAVHHLAAGDSTALGTEGG